MSRSDDWHQARRWLDTADADWRAARTLMEAGHHAHACFAAQQCGEKAVKALWYALGEEPWGHAVQKLVMQYPDLKRMEDLEQWVETAAALDRFYIPTRYPNGLPDLTPGETYFKRDAEQALEQGEWLLVRCRKMLDAMEKEQEGEMVGENEVACPSAQGPPENTELDADENGI